MVILCRNWYRNLFMEEYRLKCKKCGATEDIKKIKQFGILCYHCFDDVTTIMCAIQEQWLMEEIIPKIKQNVSDNIMNFEGDEFPIIHELDASSGP